MALTASVAACASPAARVTPLDHLAALEGQYFPIQSREAKHLYHVYIRYPEGYAEQPKRRFPIVYLLDGDSLFPHLASLQLFLHYDDKLPDALVVGIAYGSFDPPQNRRRQDYTNGAAAFGQFLERELIPAVESRVRAQPDRRILFGQSRGGGYVLHSAFTNPDLFWGRIASNPTLDLLPALNRPPTAATRPDLHLLVISGAEDQPQYRAPLLRWFGQWQSQAGLPWALRTETLAGGTHAADAGRVYRLGMNWLFAVPDKKPATH
ncbi:MAG: alpha/beta hydrolase [Sphingomonas sp.]|nr:alpha/beta hydrolase [Sphingomonas sp.]